MNLNFLKEGTRYFNEKAKRTAFKSVFSTEEGQSVLAMLAETNFVFQSSHASDPYTSAWQEGQRTAVMAIINLVGADLETIRRKIDSQEEARRRQNNLQQRA